MPAAWDALAALLGRTWPHAHGAQLGLARLAIDTGYEAPAVYAWARRQGFAQVAPIKGVEGFNRASPVSGPTYVDATEGGKQHPPRRPALDGRGRDLQGRDLPLPAARCGRPTRSSPRVHRSRRATCICRTGSRAEWLKQFVAEQLVTVKTKRGFSRLEWQKLRERNEALDCRVYARAAAWIAGADRWTEARWADLEAQLGAGDDDRADGGRRDPPVAVRCDGGRSRPLQRCRIVRPERVARATWADSMATVAELKARREALSASRASGVARVSYDGRTRRLPQPRRDRPAPSRRSTARSPPPRAGRSSGRSA